MCIVCKINYKKDIINIKLIEIILVLKITEEKNKMKNIYAL